MLIRSIKASDTPDLAALHLRCFGEECWSEEQLRGSLLLDTTQGFLVEEGDGVCGFVLAQVTVDQSEILTIAVDPSHRRKGHARNLLQELSRTRKTGCVFLEVAADNQAAIRLYESCGFEVIGRRSGYYVRPSGAVDAVTYRLLVNAR